MIGRATLRYRQSWNSNLRLSRGLWGNPPLFVIVNFFEFRSPVHSDEAFRDCPIYLWINASEEWSKIVTNSIVDGGQVDYASVTAIHFQIRQSLSR